MANGARTRTSRHLSSPLTALFKGVYACPESLQNCILTKMPGKTRVVVCGAASGGPVLLFGSRRGRNTMVTDPPTSVTVLAILPDPGDQGSMRRIFDHSKWELRFARTLHEAQAALQDLRIGVVVCESCLADGRCWKDLLSHTAAMAPPPPLIVTDRLADDSLWAEVLNLGGYDLLMKPFDEGEVRRVVTLAWHCWKDHIERGAAPRKGPDSEDPPEVAWRASRDG
jgi:hypothetical protein